MAADCSVCKAAPESGISHDGYGYRQNLEHESTAASQVSPKSQIAALLLCIFLACLARTGFMSARQAPACCICSRAACWGSGGL